MSAEVRLLSGTGIESRNYQLEKLDNLLLFVFMKRDYIFR